MAVTTLYMNLIPVVGVVSGYLILNERVLPIQIGGGLLTIIAIIIVNSEQTGKPVKTGLPKQVNS